MTLIAGSFQRFLWGFEMESQKNSFSLHKIFSFAEHLSPIRCAAVSGSVAVTGGEDATIRIYDLSTLSKMGSLHRSSPISSLCFYTSHSSSTRNLIAADHDGALIIYDTNPFGNSKILEGLHSKKRVNDLSVHPSNAFALTVGNDQFLAGVNLVKGKISFRDKLYEVADVVGYSESGDTYFLAIENTISIYSSENRRLTLAFDTKTKINWAAPGYGGILFTGGGDNNITAWDTTAGKIAYTIEKAHSVPVTGVVVLSKTDGAGGDGPYLVASASSDGIIRVWDVRMVNKEQPQPLTQAKVKGKITCLAWSSFRSVKQTQVGNTDKK